MASKPEVRLLDLALPFRRPIRARRTRRVARAAIGAGTLGFAGVAALVRAERSAAFDLAMTLKLQERTSPRLHRLMTLVSWPGFPPQSRVLPPLIVGLAWSRGFRIESRFLVLSWGASLLSTLVKAAVRRPRPLPPTVRVALAPLGGSSFPSGHVLTYVGWYGFLAHLAAVHIDSPVTRRAAVGSLLGLVALVGPSRIEQGHHWTTDVLASYLLGLAWLLLVIELYGRSVEPREAGLRRLLDALDAALPG